MMQPTPNGKSLLVTFCFHIEFHRMATAIKCGELKKLKILKGILWAIKSASCDLLRRLCTVVKKSALRDLRRYNGKVPFFITTFYFPCFYGFEKKSTFAFQKGSQLFNTIPNVFL